MNNFDFNFDFKELAAMMCAIDEAIVSNNRRIRQVERGNSDGLFNEDIKFWKKKNEEFETLKRKIERALYPFSTAD